MLYAAQGEAASRAPLWVSVVLGIPLAGACFASVGRLRACLCCRTVLHSSLCSTGSTAMSKHLVVYVASVFVAGLGTTSSECRTLLSQSVPVCRAHRAAVHGVGVPGAALCVRRVPHAAVCLLYVPVSHFLGMCQSCPSPKSLFGVLTSMSSGSRVDGVHVWLRFA